jgi:hypothetical protein
MVEMRSRKLREAHGLNEVQAEQRVDSAADVINSTGSLFLLTSEVDAGKFTEVVASRNLPSPVETGTYEFEHAPVVSRNRKAVKKNR